MKDWHEEAGRRGLVKVGKLELAPLPSAVWPPHSTLSRYGLAVTENGAELDKLVIAADLDGEYCDLTIYHRNPADVELLWRVLFDVLARVDLCRQHRHSPTSRCAGGPSTLDFLISRSDMRRQELLMSEFRGAPGWSVVTWEDEGCPKLVLTDRWREGEITVRFPEGRQEAQFIARSNFLPSLREMLVKAAWDIGLCGPKCRLPGTPPSIIKWMLDQRLAARLVEPKCSPTHQRTSGNAVLLPANSVRWMGGIDAIVAGPALARYFNGADLRLVPDASPATLTFDWHFF